MIKVDKKEIYTDNPENTLHRKGSDVFGQRFTLLDGESKENFEELHKDSVVIPQRAPNANDVESAKAKFRIMQLEKLDDINAEKIKELYPTWKEKIGHEVKVGERLYYNNHLYKVRQVHLVQRQFYPSINTASLYEEINEKHNGTLDDAIPYNNNMRLELGKYYSQNNIIYKCTRDSEIAVYQNLSELINIYVVIV